MRASSFAALLVFTFAASAGMPSLAAQDLLQTWQAALGNDPVYSAARANYRAGLEKLPQARAGLLPQVTAEAGGAYLEDRSRNWSSSVSRGRGTWDLALTQPLFNWASWQNFEQSKLTVTDVEVQLQQAYQDLLLRVSDAYFNVLAAQDTLTATEAEKASIAEQLASAKRNFELGTATITDTYEAQSRYDLVMAQELLFQNLLEVRRDQLATIIGAPPGALAVLPYSVQLPAPQPARLKDWSVQAESASLNVLRAQLQTRIAQRDIEIAKSGHYPTVNLRASSGSASDTSMPGPYTGRAINNAVGVTLSIPLYSGGGVSSLVTEKVQLEQKARYDFETARRLAIQFAREHYTGVITGLARVQALEAGEKSSRASVDANRIGYEVGVRINLDVLNAQQQLYATQRDLAQARYNTVISGLRLRATSGILSEADLESINRLLREPQ